MKVFLNGRLVDARRAQVSVFDHGFLYGDGIYETVHAYDYKIFEWPAHMRRFRDSAQRLGLRCPWGSEYLRRSVVKLLRANHTPEASVRITVSRGPGAIGLDPRLCKTPTLVMLTLPPRPVAQLQQDGVSIGIVRVRRNHTLCLDPRIKANNSLNTIFARVEATRMKVFEGVLTNLEGHLTEGTISNLFFVRRGALHTPHLDCGLLEGVTRGRVIRLAKALNIPLKEGRYPASALRQADEVFLSSTTLEVMPVVRIVDGSGSRPKAFQVSSGHPGPLTRRLQDQFHRL